MGHRILHFLKHEKKSVAWGVILVVLVQIFEYHGWLAGIEGRVVDLYLHYFTRKSAEKARIVTVEIDDAAYRACFWGSPMSPPVIHDLLAPLIGDDKQPHPNVMGIDILTDSDLSYDPLRMLAAESANNTRIVWTAPVAASTPVAPTLGEWLMGKDDELRVEAGNILGYTPNDADANRVLWAVPAFPTDEDLRLRRFPRRIREAGVAEEQTTWAAKIAAIYGHVEIPASIPDVIVTYNVDFLREYKVGQLFTCDKGKTPGGPTLVRGTPELDSYRDLIKQQDPIVLVGGTFASGRDDYQTPEGSKPGLLINAYAMQGEFKGKGVSEAPRLLLIGLDLIVGLIIAYVFTKGVEIRGMMWRSLPVLGGVLLLSLCAFWMGYLWLSVLGIGAGFMPHLLLEIYLKKPIATR